MAGTASAHSEGAVAAGMAVRLEGIRKRFGYREVLRGIDLEVRAGSCLALFGSNGAGKSTLLRIVATLSTPSGGRAAILGLELPEQAEAIRRRLGVILHRSMLRPELSLEENLRFFSSLYGLAGADRAGDLLERFRLSAAVRQPVKTFSQGMLKRANIIRSLLNGPDLWLLDEPFSGLDPEGRDVLRGLLREHVDGGRSALLVTHQTELGRELAGRTVTIEDGEIAAEEVVDDGEHR